VIKRHLDDFAEYLREGKNNFLDQTKADWLKQCFRKIIWKFFL
jgi:hypothetical protein